MGKPFAGKHVPFGAMIRFIPNTTTKLGKTLPKFAPTSVEGVFLGWELRRGNTWSKAYRVTPLSDLTKYPFESLPTRNDARA